MKAQTLYDLRELTGFVSGNELHDMFDRLLGEPSPSGYKTMNLIALKKDPVGKQALDLLGKSLWHTIDAIAKYTRVN